MACPYKTKGEKMSKNTLVRSPLGENIFRSMCASILLVSSLVVNAQESRQGGISASLQFAKGTLIVKFAPQVKLQESKGTITTGVQTIDKLNEKYAVKQQMLSSRITNPVNRKLL